MYIYVCIYIYIYIYIYVYIYNKSVSFTNKALNIIYNRPI